MIGVGGPRKEGWAFQLSVGSLGGRRDQCWSGSAAWVLRESNRFERLRDEGWLVESVLTKSDRLRELEEIDILYFSISFPGLGYGGAFQTPL